jgi:hypothetical protein
LADAASQASYNQFITFPFNVANFNNRTSEYNWNVQNGEGPLWY